VSEVRLEDFLAEAEDLLDRLTHGLLELDRAIKNNTRQDPGLINDIFRSAHSLKGICGMFGFQEVGEIAHKLEDLLDRLRLGKLKLTAENLDVLFEVSEELRGIISKRADGEEVKGEQIQAIKQKLSGIEEVKSEDDHNHWLKESLVSDEILSVLTEYEEHRLVENVKEGMNIFQVSASFKLSSFDEELVMLQAKLKELGELITTALPGTQTGEDDSMDFLFLLGSDKANEEIEAHLYGYPVSVSIIKPGKYVKAKPVVRSEKQEAETIALEEEEELSKVKSLSRTVRVDIGKLDNLMNIVGELVLSKNVLAQLIERLKDKIGFSELALELIKANRMMERKLQELQMSVLEVRMVPIGQIYDKLRRSIRKLARETGKEVEFIAEGGGTELDKLIIEDLADPLMHIIRNSIDHGIEPKEQRVKLGKPAQGQIKLKAFQRGNHVVIEIIDDGAGLNFEKIKKKAIEMSLLSAGQEIKEDDLVQVLFNSGFSTAEKVSELSGRGVGLDVVKNNIGALSGAIDIESSAGKGTKVIITLPITLAIIQALIVVAGSETFAVPLNAVSSGLAIKPEEIKTIEGREVIEQRERTLPLLRLDRFFNLKSPSRTDSEEVYVVTVGIAERKLGIVVDKLLGRQDIVIKSIGDVLSGIKGIAGAAELGDQRTILVLDVVGLIEGATSGLGSRRMIAEAQNVS